MALEKELKCLRCALTLYFLSQSPEKLFGGVMYTNLIKILFINALYMTCVISESLIFSSGFPLVE